MSEVQSGFPRRDAEGRIATLGDLLGISLAGVVIGALVLVLFDWAVSMARGESFGRANGWLAVILPAWLFLEDFRAWGSGPARVIAALVAVVVGIVGGLLVAGFAAGLPALATGVLAAAAFTVLYAVIWFYGVRWLAARLG